MKTEIDLYRNKPLEMDEFEKLDVLAEKNITFKKRFVDIVVWVTDEYGEKKQQRDLVERGSELFVRRDIDQRLIDSLRRQAPAKSMIVHFTRLAQHKPFGRGNEGWAIVLEDLCKDLQGMSEYAIIKVCEQYRQDTEITFFPDTAKLQTRIRDLDASLRHLNDPPMNKIDGGIYNHRPVFEQDGLEKRQRVAGVMHDAHLPHSPDFCLQCKEGIQP